MYFRKHGIEYVFMGIHMSLFSGTDYTIISGGGHICARKGKKNILGSPQKNGTKSSKFPVYETFLIRSIKHKYLIVN